MPGAVVRLTRYFLSAVGQQPNAGWTVIACDCELCSRGLHVAVNEPAPADPFGNGTLAWGSPWRHIHFSNLEEIDDEAAPLTPRVRKDPRSEPG